MTSPGREAPPTRPVGSIGLGLARDRRRFCLYDRMLSGAAKFRMVPTMKDNPHAHRR
jgi:hypothetical protein